MPATALGVTRFDVVCSPQVSDVVQALASRWAQDRALPRGARDRMRALVGAGLGHGLRFRPRAVALLLCWEDSDRVRLELRWLGCSRMALADPAHDPNDTIDWDDPEGAHDTGGLAIDHDVDTAVDTFDTHADAWGFGTAGSWWVQWMVVDAT